MTCVDAAVVKPRLLIVGAGGHGRSVAEAVLMSDDFELVGFLNDGAFAPGNDVLGLPVLSPAAGFAHFAEDPSQGEAGHMRQSKCLYHLPIFFDLFNPSVLFKFSK